MTGLVTTKTVTTNTSNTKGIHSTPAIVINEESSLCGPEPNQPVSKLNYQIKTKSRPNQKGIESVFCRFREGSIHLPHAMQQLYRCYSLWRDYPKADPVFLVKSYDSLQELYLHPFTTGLLTVFHLQMNLTAALEDEIPPGVSNVDHIPSDTLDVYQNSESTIFESFGGSSDYNLRHTKFLHRIVGKELNLADHDRTKICLHHSNKPRIGILNRDADQYKRSILNVQEIANAVQNFSRNESVQVKYFEESDFEDQVKFFRSVDILVSPHGAQLAGVAFMNAPCAQVLELFPKRYHVPRFFGSLVMESKMEYSYIYLSGNSSRLDKAKTRKERAKARAVNLCPSVDLMTDTIRTLADQWRQCCDNARGHK